MAKYYALKTDQIKEIYESWEECQKNLKGKSNVKHKSFLTRLEAEAWLDGIDLSIDVVEENRKNNCCTAFCDGSYDETVDNYSGAFLLFTTSGEESNQAFLGKLRDIRNIEM